MEEPKPDPGNAPPSKWKGEPYDDTEDINIALAGHTDIAEAMDTEMQRRLVERLHGGDDQ